jgi:hypothetical protein
MWRAISIVGMVLLVVAYVLNQRGIWRPADRAYLLANAVGAFLLTVYSWRIGEWVFVGLEGFWCAVSARELLPRSRAA